MVGHPLESKLMSFSESGESDVDDREIIQANYVSV